MDYAYAIKRHRKPLLVVIAGLYAMIGIAQGGMIDKLKRPLYRKVLGLLRPAEAAVRRLIVAMAHGLEVKPKGPRAAPKGLAGLGKKGKGKGRRSFRLCDPRLKDVDFSRRAKGPKAVPRIHFFDGDSWRTVDFGPTPPQPPAPEPKPEPDDTVNAVPLCLRLDAALRALKDLPGQARRYARWWAKPVEKRRPKLATALRRGPPPGFNHKSSHEVHAILKECQWLAHTALKPDTS